MVWLVLLAGVTVPAWYWVRAATFNNGQQASGLHVRLLPERPERARAAGVFVDTLHQALIAAAVFLVLFLLFNYVLVGAARLHARVATALLRAPADPMAKAKEVLTKPGPLGPLHPEPKPAEPLHPEPLHPQPLHPAK